MRIVHYARPGQLDTVVPRVLALSRLAEVHLVLETSPEETTGGVFGPVPNTLQPGVHADVWRSLSGWLPAGLEMELAQVRLHRVVHDCARAFYPRTIALSARVARFIRALRADVVHFDDTWTRAALTFPLLGRQPIVASVHDMEAHPGEERPRAELIRRLAWRQVQHMVFYSRYCQQLYSQQAWMPHVRSSVVPFGVVDIFRAWQRRTLATEPRSVLLFGRLSAYKGVPVFLAAAPLIARAVPHSRFIIAGSLAGRFSMPALQPLDDGGQYEVLAQYIPNDLTCELFQRATLVAVPYTSATQSGVVMTAYGFGKPVVATRVGGLPEMVEPKVTGALVPPNDPVALADAIVDMLRDTPSRDAMQAVICRRARDEYSWERHAASLLRIYEQVIQPVRMPAVWRVG